MNDKAVKSKPGWVLIVEVVTVLVLLATAGVGLVVAIENRQNIKEIHITINSRMDELLSVTKELAHARGVVEGRDE